jgi:hypothetical protein
VRERGTQWRKVKQRKDLSGAEDDTIKMDEKEDNDVMKKKVTRTRNSKTSRR